MSNLSEREKLLVRRAYLTGQKDMFTELPWEQVYAVVEASVDSDDEDGSTPEDSQAGEVSGAEPDTITEGA